MPQLRTEMDAATQAAATDNRRRKRVILYRNDDGSIDTSALNDTDKQNIGIGTPVANPVEEAVAPIDPAVVGIMIGILTNVEALVVAPRMGITADQARGALTPPQPVAEKLNDAACRVLNKYGGTLGKYADELALAAVIVMWQTTAFAEMKRMQPAPQTPPPPIDRHESIQAPPVEVLQPKKEEAANNAPVFEMPSNGVITDVPTKSARKGKES